MADSFWDVAGRVALLTELNAAGHSASAIARALGDGCTRNMAISKISRLKLNAGRPKAQPRPKAPPKPKPPAASRVPAAPKARPAEQELDAGEPLPSSAAWEALPGTTPVPLTEHGGKGFCRWPIGEGPFLFCNVPTGDGAPVYCPLHERRARTVPR